ncbi:hypothetical protein [Mesobacillus boroniphilus]|uniref:hypothetical protein n=1 Tax=Mesobacillus boroniphilus TaxID=308892 RepID=UPI001BCA953A|nr:hypothetical protein [Mesobacillus boroniphilus]
MGAADILGCLLLVGPARSKKLTVSPGELEKTRDFFQFANKMKEFPIKIENRQ